MSKLAVLFPGIGYTADKPLLYFSRRIAADLGYEIRILGYSGFPPKIQGDRGRMEESFRIAFDQSVEMLSDIDFNVYDDILFIGKSIGTIVAAKIASDSSVKGRIRLVLYTPLEETFSFDFGDAIVFTGSDDPWVGKDKSRIRSICEGHGIPCQLVPDANHSLETKDPLRDMEMLSAIMKQTEEFINLL